MHEYYEDKAKDGEELVWLSCKLFAAVVAVVIVVGVVAATVKWIIAL